MRKWTFLCVAGMLSAGMFMPAVASAGERQVREDYARELAGRLPSTQVWAVDRREQNLADLSGFRSGHPDRSVRAGAD